MRGKLKLLLVTTIGGCIILVLVSKSQFYPVVTQFCMQTPTLWTTVGSQQNIMPVNSMTSTSEASNPLLTRMESIAPVGYPRSQQGDFMSHGQNLAFPVSPKYVYPDISNDTSNQRSTVVMGHPSTPTSHTHLHSSIPTGISNRVPKVGVSHRNVLSVRANYSGQCKDELCLEYLSESENASFYQCINKSKHQEEKFGPIHKGSCHFMKSSEIFPVALASFPGSGNTWVRGLLQKATGICTGMWCSFCW